MARRALFPWWLLALGGVGALVLYLRYTKGGQEFLVDAIEEVTIGAKKVGSAIAATLGSWASKVPAALKGVFSAATLQYGLPPLLLEAVAYRESRFRPEIISGALRSRAGAVGIMQIIPKWHPQLGEEGAKDPARAIPYGASYLRELYNKYREWPAALAAYNWGPGNFDNWIAATRTAQEQGSTLPRWPAETREYVDEITRNAGLV